MEAHGVVFSPINVFPVKINGEMISGEFTIKGNISSQFITGLLFALPLLNGNSIINVIPPVESRPYIDMTSRKKVIPSLYPEGRNMLRRVLSNLRAIGQIRHSS